MSNAINVDSAAVTEALRRFKNALADFDTAASAMPVEVDAGAATLLVSELVGEIIDGSIRLLGEADTLTERAEGAIGDLTGFDQSTGASLSKLSRGIQ